MGGGDDHDAEVAACGLEMGLKPWPETAPEQSALTLAAWKAGDLRLIVLDNAEKPEVLQEWLPRLGKSRVLPTLRREEWPGDLGLHVYRLGG